MQWLHAQCSIYIVHFVDCWAIFRQQNCNREIEQCACSVHCSHTAHSSHSNIACNMVSSETWNIFWWYIFSGHFIIKLYEKPDSFRISHPICTSHIHKWFWAHVCAVSCELSSTVIACPTISHQTPQTFWCIHNFTADAITKQQPTNSNYISLNSENGIPNFRCLNLKVFLFKTNVTSVLDINTRRYENNEWEICLFVHEVQNQPKKVLRPQRTAKVKYCNCSYTNS